MWKPSCTNTPPTHINPSFHSSLLKSRFLPHLSSYSHRAFATHSNQNSTKTPPVLIVVFRHSVAFIVFAHTPLVTFLIFQIDGETKCCLPPSSAPVCIKRMPTIFHILFETGDRRAKGTCTRQTKSREEPFLNRSRATHNVKQTQFFCS